MCRLFGTRKGPDCSKSFTETSPGIFPSILCNTGPGEDTCTKGASVTQLCQNRAPQGEKSAFLQTKECILKLYFRQTVKFIG